MSTCSYFAAEPKQIQLEKCKISMHCIISIQHHSHQTFLPVLVPPPRLEEDGEVVMLAAGGGAWGVEGVTVETCTFVTSASIVYPAEREVIQK